MDPNPTLHRYAEAAEATDNGHRLALAMERELLAIADAPVTHVPLIESIDPGDANAVGRHLADARASLIEAAKRADSPESRGLHIDILTKASSIDDLQAPLSEFTS